MSRTLMKLLGVLLALTVSTATQAETYYFHNDHLGTPQVVTDSRGEVVWKGHYTPFGEVEESVALIEQNLRFPGQYHDRDTGLYYNYFRNYDPSTGRYIQSDPIGLRGGLNTYLYADANPIRYVDPLGLNPAAGAIGGGAIAGPPGAVIGGIIGFGIGIALGHAMLNGDASSSDAGSDADATDGPQDCDDKPDCRRHPRGI